MPRGSNLKQYWFKEGCAPGPGRPRMTDEEKEVRRFTRESISEAINTIAELKDAEVETLLSDPDATQVEKIVAKVLLVARSTGDFTQMDKLLDRCIGKVPQKLEGEFFGKGGAPLVPPAIILQPVKAAEKVGP